MKILLLSLLFIFSGFFFKSYHSKAAEVVNVIKSSNYRTVRAEIYYQESKGSISAPRLKINHAGQNVFNEAIEIQGQEAFSKIVSPLAVDLDGDWEAEIVVDLGSKSSKGLDYSVIYKYDTVKKKYIPLIHQWGDFSYGRTVQDIDKDGSLEFITFDNRFAEKFAPGDGTVGPTKIWKLKDGKIVEVTDQFKAVVYSNATKLWDQFDQQRKAKKKDLALQRLLLASYLGDKYTLGQEEDGWKLIKENYKFKDQKKYFNLLKTFLNESGYTAIQNSEQILEVKGKLQPSANKSTEKKP